MSATRKPARQKAAPNRRPTRRSPSDRSAAGQQAGPAARTDKTDGPALQLADRRLRLIARVTGAVVGAEPLARLARGMARQVCSAFSVDACIIRLLEKDELVLLANAGVAGSTLLPRIPTTWGGTQEILSRREAVCIPDVHTTPATAPIMAHLRRPFRFKSYAGAPLVVRNRVVGIIGVYSRQGFTSFGEADLGCLQIIGNSIAAAIVNSRLFEELTQQKDQLESQTLERKRAQAALQASRDQLQVLSDNLAHGMVYQINSGPDGRTRRFTYVSTAVERLHGLKVKDVLEDESLIYGQVIPEDMGLVRERETHSYKTLTRFDLDVRIRPPSGEICWRRFMASPRRQSDGSVVWDGIEIDITDRRQAEEALRASEAKYRTLVQNIPGMVYRAYPDWTADIISNAKSLCGYTGEEISSMKQGWLDVIHPKDRKSVLREGEPLRHSAGLLVQNYRIITKDGRVKWVEDRKVSLFSEDGSFLGIDGVVLDITQRKQDERSLRVSRRDLARLSRDRETLLEEERVRIARHLHDELGQSLTFLALELSRLQKRARKEDPSLSGELGQVCEQARRMILDTRAIARSLRPISIEHDGLVPSLRSCIQDFQRASGVTCRLICRLEDCPVSEPVATTVYRIIQEALTNIARHAGASRCEIRIEASRSGLELLVEDDGTGARAGALDGHQSLGIIGMKERASAVGGRLQVQNGPRSGVVVKACFPLRGGGNPRSK
jgi:two-component system sensor histidine kinase UhpB